MKAISMKNNGVKDDQNGKIDEKTKTKTRNQLCYTRIDNNKTNKAQASGASAAPHPIGRVGERWDEFGKL